jgi:prevent-host-death family protein
MQRIQLDKDIKPLSEFRSKVATYLDHVHNTKRPLLITQNGKSSAVLMDVNEYEAIIDRIEVLQDIQVAKSQIEEGKGLSHSEAKKLILDKVSL